MRFEHGSPPGTAGHETRDERRVGRNSTLLVDLNGGRIMTLSPTITVGLPVYNGEPFLRAALDGVLAQTFGDFILLISDNASTDATQDICEECARRDRRVRYVRQDTNRGAARNLNILAEMATTPLFMWHAADDIAHPQLIEICVAHLDEAPDAVLAYTEAEVIDQHGNAVPCTPEPRDIGSSMPTERFAACLEPFHYSENVFYGVIRTEILQRTRRHGIFGGGDRALCAELSLYGPFIRIPRVLFRRRIGLREATGAEIQSYNTGRARAFTQREWRILWHNLGSIRRAPVTSEERRDRKSVV